VRDCTFNSTFLTLLLISVSGFHLSPLVITWNLFLVNS